MKSTALTNEEQILKYIYEHHITPDNYQKHEMLLRSFFADEESYLSFIDSNLAKFSSIFSENFLREGQHIDAFFHPRFSQQEFHIHDFFEIKYQLKGTGTVIVGNETVFLRESDLCFIAPFTPHCSEIFDPDSYMINLVVVPRYIPQLMPRILQYPNFVGDFFCRRPTEAAACSPFLYIHTDFNHDIERCITDIFHYYRENTVFTPIGDLSTEADLERFLLILLQNQMASCQPKNQTKQNQQLYQMMEYIQNHLNSVTFSDVAQHFHYSESYTSRFIKKYTGQNFTNILKVLRLKKAAELLASSDITVDQIAQQIGYPGKTNFYNSFKKYYGVTPAKFRKTT